MWKSSPTLISFSITNRNARVARGARDGRLSLLGWGRSLWPLREIARREDEVASRLLAMVPHSQLWMADLGCGKGSAPSSVRRETCLGVDWSRRMVCASRYNKEGLALCADLAALPLREHRFGLLLLIGVAEYWRDPEPLLRQVARLLAREGHLLLTVSPAGWHALFRRLLGSPVYIHKEEVLAGLFARCHLQVKARLNTPTQHLYLLTPSATAGLNHPAD